MPGYVPSEAALATKLVTLYPDNAQKGLNTHSAIIILMNPDNGQILAVSYHYSAFLQITCVSLCILFIYR